MFEKIMALTVVLDQEIQEKEIEPLVNAIRQMRNVIKVETKPVDELAVMVAESRVRLELAKRIFPIISGKEI